MSGGVWKTGSFAEDLYEFYSEKKKKKYVNLRLIRVKPPLSILKVTQQAAQCSNESKYSKLKKQNSTSQAS